MLQASGATGAPFAAAIYVMCKMIISFFKITFLPPLQTSAWTKRKIVEASWWWWWSTTRCVWQEVILLLEHAHQIVAQLIKNFFEQNATLTVRSVNSDNKASKFWLPRIEHCLPRQQQADFLNLIESGHYQSPLANLLDATLNPVFLKSTFCIKSRKNI